MRTSFPQGGITKNHIQGKIKKWKRKWTYYILHNLLWKPKFDWNQNENRLVVKNEV
ncbi:hypothetical protein RHMOL_Rhmol05G0216400 [Rhododendron molle]|uniref:Uncharacterized protein n=1 Tax=Rhododendron molle TaxID=49168 RepID=A0ACC0NSX9_RHOML|nr:hypothetical protein RHMOL_Rhmol05G0216400 [Rhododendron molle]